MSETVEIRVVGEDDRSLLDRVAPDVFDHAIRRDQTERFLGDPRHHLVVALDDGLIVGMASSVEYFHPDKEPALWINEVGVAPSHRRRGIATRLIERTLRLAREIGCSTVWVGTESDNLAARRLYAATGAKIETERFVAYEWKLDRD